MDKGKRTRPGRIHRQDCVCTRCIVGLNPRRIPRTINNKHNKRDEIYDTDIRFEKEEPNRKPIYRDFFYNDIVEQWDDYIRILERKDRQLDALKQEIKNLEDWVRDYQQIKDIKKDINKVKNDMKELQKFNKTIILNEVKEQVKQARINELNEQTKKIEQRKQTKKFKED